MAVVEEWPWWIPLGGACVTFDYSFSEYHYVLGVAYVFHR